jgi:hypothetical protein
MELDVDFNLERRTDDPDGSTNELRELTGAPRAGPVSNDQGYVP